MICTCTNGCSLFEIRGRTSSASPNLKSDYVPACAGEAGYGAGGGVQGGTGRDPPGAPQGKFLNRKLLFC